MTKSEIRKIYKSKREALGNDEVDDLSLKIANQLLNLKIWDYTNYHIFLSIQEKKEIQTDYILNILSGKDKNIVVPKTNFKGNTLSHFLLTDNTTIKVNNWGIPEPLEGIEIAPKQIDVVFVPLLAFDLHGHRVGYGKGFYDRFLNKCKPEVITIGLSLFPPIKKIEGIHPGDIPLKFVVSPNDIYKF